MQDRPGFPNPFRFLWENRDTFLLAILLSIAVWVSAVYANDPNIEAEVEGGVELRLSGLPDSSVILNDLPENVRVRLRAPESIWQTIGEDPSLVRATINLANLGTGEHTVQVEVGLQVAPAQVLEVIPSQLTVSLDDFIILDELPLNLKESGQIAPGFQLDSASLLLESVTASGPASRMDLVTQVIATVPLQDARQSFTTTVGLFPANADGQVVSGVELDPKVADVDVKISQAGQYRDVAVVVETRGEPAEGYERTSIDVDPLIVTLYAENEEDILDIPGFVSTKPIFLADKIESFVIQIGLELPEGVIQAGNEQTVAVSIGISPKVRNATISVPISIRDLAPGFSAELSPDNVEVFLTGPEPIMNTLTAEDLVVFVSLDGLEAGTFFVELAWDVLLEQVDVVSINPDTIEVIINVVEEGDQLAPTVTPTPAVTPTVTP